MTKVLIGLSGGVDSAVAAYLLKKQWYDVTAGFMKNYVSETGNCTTYDDATEAIKVAKFLWIKLLSFDLQKEYNEKIITYIYEGYRKWITPNPDVLCNSLIKFDVFLKKALDMGFDFIATGHYARILPPKPPFEWGLELNADDVKKRWLMRNGKQLPYSPILIERARELRKHTTPAEKKLREEFLQSHTYKFYRQRPIDHFIADFYCSQQHLIIEVDWGIHNSPEAKEYDKMRTELLNLYWMKVIRFSNDEIMNNFSAVCKQIDKKIISYLPSKGRPGGVYKLLKWIDHNKDQSYFLSGLDQFQLSKSLFPLGDIEKPEVRRIAKQVWLPNAERKDSQGLCFVGNIPIRTFLEQKLPKKVWITVDESRRQIGKHEGARFFTIGQRQGLNLPPDHYVTKIDVKRNIVHVGPRGSEFLNQKEINLTDRHRIGYKYDLPLDVEAKIRYRQTQPAKCRLSVTRDAWRVTRPKLKTRDSKLVTASFHEAQRAIAPGQIVVAYIWEECVWSGVIV